MDLDKDKLESVSSAFKANTGSEGSKGFIQKIKGLFGGEDESDLMKKAMKSRKEKLAMNINNG